MAGNPIGSPYTRERVFRIVLRAADQNVIAVRAELDGQAAAPEQETRFGQDFAFSYRDFLEGRSLTAQRDLIDDARMQEEELARLGMAVGRVVFPAPVAASLAKLLDETRAANEAVVLAFETRDRRLLSIPFEAARLPDGHLPALEPGVRLLRRHLGAQAGAARPLPGPLRILVAVGAPDEGKTLNTALDVESELQTILDAVDAARAYGDAEVKILEVGHPAQIRSALLAGSYHVLHLSGHGTAGMMELETEDGEPLEVSAEDLAGAIRASQKPLPLVVLATCHGGVATTDTASFAQGLLEHGIPMVLAMQSSVSDWYAIHLAGAFYGHLTRPDVRFPSHALSLARQDVETRRREALSQGREGDLAFPEYATPSLFCAGDEIPLLDWNAAQLESHRHSPQPVTGPVPLLKIGELIGRREYLRELLRILLDDPPAVAKYGRKSGAVLQGIGGVGKSALAGRAMSRLADRGWRLVAVEGRWTSGELATRVGETLITDEDGTIQRLAGLLMRPDLPDKARLQILNQLLASHKILLVLDNFEDNLTLAGTTFLDASTGLVLDALFRSCHQGKILITSRYPVPISESWLVPLILGPLSPAQTRKLLYRLTALKDRPPEVLGKILRMIGGHPRVLEYLDAILHKGTGRLSIVEEKLRKNVNRLGLRVEDLGGNLEQSLQDSIRVGAQDILLDELLDTALEDPEYRQVLEQASVFPMPIDLQGLTFALEGAQEPVTERIGHTRGVAGQLVRTSLLIPLEEDSVWVHRWTAEALKERMGNAVQEYCRRAGECLLWKLRNRKAADPIEAVRLLLQGADFDKASQWAWTLVEWMNSHGQSLAALSFLEDVLSGLPGAYDEFPGFLREAADSLFRLGLVRVAEERYNQALQLSEQRALEHPNRADYQRDLSVSYERMGDLLRALGQGEQAKTFYEKDLAIAERLAADEPNRADYQTDLVVSLMRVAPFDPEDSKAMLLRALSILEGLKERGVLLPMYVPWIDDVREMLDSLDESTSPKAAQP